MKILLTFFVLFFSSSVLAKDFKGYMCNWHIASVHAKDNCDGTNSWYKVYFPAKFKTKAICMAGFVGKKFGSAKITLNTNTE